MVMEELMLVNLENTTRRKRRRKQKTLADHLSKAGPQVKDESRIHRQGQKQSPDG